MQGLGHQGRTYGSCRVGAAFPPSSLSTGLPWAFHRSSKVLAVRCLSSEPTKGPSTMKQCVSTKL